MVLSNDSWKNGGTTGESRIIRNRCWFLGKNGSSGLNMLPLRTWNTNWMCLAGMWEEKTLPQTRGWAWIYRFGNPWLTCNNESLDLKAVLCDNEFIEKRREGIENASIQKVEGSTKGCKWNRERTYIAL